MAQYLENAYAEIEKAKRRRETENPFLLLGCSVREMMEAIREFSNRVKQEENGN